MSVEQRLEGAVAALLSDRELAINVGLADGVMIGMRFKIVAREGIDVKDPTTGAVLGSVEVAKTIVKVVQVQEKLCVARTFREYKTGGLLFGTSLGASATVVETLKSDDPYAFEDLDDANLKVKVGDPAIQVLQNDEVILRPPNR